jgi:CRISPR type III-B/RAMP module RAMP protein Cmr6
MTLDNLKLDFFDSNRNAVLVETEGQHRKVSVSAVVMQKAFITRAWLDRTLVACAVGKCHLGAEVAERGNRLEATKVWLSLEKNYPNESKGMFKNFGLELNKPQSGTQAFSDLTSVTKEKVTGKLARRFLTVENPDKTKSQPDLCNFRFDNDFIEKLSKRHLDNAKALTQNSLLVQEFTPDWRMVTGMGEASVYETSMTLHHVYGIPYIPASTIKGVLRHYLNELEDGKKHIEKIFGESDTVSSTKRPVRGTCVFFDAFPLTAPRIELDVMTPHYPDYYTGDKPPADWQSPNPIHFLTIGKGTRFRFIVGTPGLDDAMKGTLRKWLEEALQHRGMGAKTAVGYGYWEKLDAN